MKKLFGLFLVGVMLVIGTGLSAYAQSANAGIEVIPVSSFSDVEEWMDTFQAIDYFRSEGVVVGYSDGTYGIDRDINRAEFLKIVMEVSDYQPGGSDCYPDVADQWFAPYVCSATEEGLVEGYPDGYFRPEANINFAEASKIVANTLGVDMGEQGSNWFDQFVYGLEDISAIPASINGFDHNVTRSEMAEMVWRIDTETKYDVSNTYSNIASGIEISERGGELETFNSCSDLKRYFENNSYNDNYRYFEDDIMVDMVWEESMDDVVESETSSGESAKLAAPTAADEEGGAGDFSETNVQVEGVDEADIVKNDGKFIYYLRGDTVRIVDAYPPNGMEEVSKVTFADSSFYPSEMFVDDDRMIIIGYSYSPVFDDYTYGPNVRDGGYSYYTFTKVYVFDISDRSDVEKLRELSFEGDYTTSRKVDDTVYVVMNQWNYYLPYDGDDWKEGDIVPLWADSESGEFDTFVDCGQVRYMPGVTDSTDYTIVASVDVSSADGAVDKEVIMGATGDVYASRDNIYLAEPKYNYSWWYEESGDSEQTFVHKFGIEGTDISYDGMGEVPGTVNNQFSMDEKDGFFRVATTLGDFWDPSSNNLYVLDENMEIAGKVEGLAPGEEIYSVRYVGDRVYMVTFEQIDPLFVIDLSDPRAPEVLGELKIPGVSNYLHPYDEDHIIGFGLDTLDPDTQEELGWQWFDGIKVAMFDVSDVENPKELHKITIGDRGTYSELSYNHKALLFDKDKGIMAFPITVYEIPDQVKEDLDVDPWTYGDMTFQGAYVLDIDLEDGFSLRGRITHYPESSVGSDFDYYYYDDYMKVIERILYIGDYFYTVSEAMVKANEMDGLGEASMMEFVE